MNITMTFIRDDAPITIILDFVNLPVSHTGENMGKAFSKVVHEWGIEDKVRTNALERNALLTHLHTGRLYYVR